MRLTSGRRAIWLSVLFVLIFGALGGRVYHLQVVKGERYAHAAYRQRTLSLPVASRRGMILDRTGKPLTDPQPGWGIAAFPPLMNYRNEVVRALSPVLWTAEEDLLARLPDRGDPHWMQPVWLAPQVTEQQAQAVRSMRLPGIVAAPVGFRYGPKSLARHLVGYVNEQGGQLGLEHSFEEHLAGDAVPAFVAYLDGRETPLAGLGVRAAMPSVGKEPYHLHTTIDSRVQKAVEQVLDRHGHPDGGPLRGAAVVMNPVTGDVLAMASRPDFDQVRDPNVRPDNGEAYLLNRALSLFEPGSVFKALVAAAALDEGVVRPDEKFFCPGHYEVGGQRFQDGNGVAHGWITFREAVAKSCNVTFAHVGYRALGAERLLQVARRFGLGAATGLGLREEEPGLLPRLQYGGQVAQLAFGQGLLVTPVQMARAFAAIANGGLLPPVRLVAAVRSPEGKVVYRPAYSRPERVMAPETARELQTALLAVTDPRGSGTGTRAWVQRGGSAGKTGSAEGTENGEETVHAWFAGYLPASAPRYVVVVLIQGGGSGGLVAAPIFREIGEELMKL